MRRYGSFPEKYPKVSRALALSGAVLTFGGIIGALGIDYFHREDRPATFPDNARDINTLPVGKVVASAVIDKTDVPAVDCGGEESGLGLSDVEYELRTIRSADSNSLQVQCIDPTYTSK